MEKGKLSYAVFYPARSYKDKCDEISCGLEECFKVKNFPPTVSKRTKKEEFLALIEDKESDVLMAWYGGQVENGDKSGSSLELVESLSESDWIQIANSKKKIVGRSDITFLLCRLMQHGVRCYYGPNYSSFADDFKGEVPALEAKKNIETTKKYLELALMSAEEYVIDFKNEEIASKSEPWTFQGGKCTGRLIGGNLDTICKMIAELDKTGFDVQKGDILLIESVDPYYCEGKIEENLLREKVMTFSKNIQILKDAGAFEKISGLILGKSKQPNFISYEFENEKSFLSNTIESLHIKAPVLANVSCSHTTPMITLPLGRIVTLDADGCTLRVYPE